MPSRGLTHLVVGALVVGSVAVGVLSAQGVLALDGAGARMVAPVRAAMSEELAAAESGEVAFELQPSVGNGGSGEGVADAMDTARVIPTPAPEPVTAIALPPPPTVRSGTTSGASLPWSGPTGYLKGDGSLQWPVPGGYISQYFWSGHLAIDIAHGYGGAVLAADGGTVISAGWRNNGGGLVVMVQHANGRVTGYNHLGSILVTAGQAVGRGQQIARVGCTGWCTGPHVHFQVIVNGVVVNPLRYL